MKTIISKKIPSLHRTTETVGGLERPKQLKDKELLGIVGGKQKLQEFSKNLKKCGVIEAYR